MHAVTVPVTDQDRSREFFVECLGFHVVSDVKLPDSEERWVAVAPPDGTGGTVGLIATPPEARIRQPASGPPTTIFVTDNLQAQFEMWEERGVRFITRPWPQSGAHIRCSRIRTPTRSCWSASTR